MKTFVLDTNVILHDPMSMFSFEGSRVVIPLTVIEELDTFKRNNDERGRSARFVSRKLDELRKGGKLSNWVPLEHGGKLKVEIQVSDGLPKAFHAHTKDNEILSCAQYLRKQGENVVFISKDINLRIKAESLGLETQDYEKEKVDVEDLYKGWREIVVGGDEIDRFYKDKRLAPPVEDLVPNEFVILKDGGSKSALSRFDAKAQALVPLIKADSAPWGIKPLNMEQRFALELLLNKDIQLVTLVGLAGSGKTMIALAAALQQTLEEKLYRRILVARPVIAVGHDFGFLPGTKEEKLTNWMGAIYDNLSYLLEKPKGSLETADMDIQMLIEEGQPRDRGGYVPARAQPAGAINAHRRRAEPDAARDQDHHLARGPGREDRPDRRPSPGGQLLPGRGVERPHEPRREVQEPAHFRPRDVHEKRALGAGRARFGPL